MLAGLVLAAALRRSAKSAAQRTWLQPTSPLAPVAVTAFTLQPAEVCYWAEPNSSLVTLQAGKAEDTGTLYVTNRRLQFVGAQQSRTIAMEDVVSVQPFEGGVRIDEARATPVAFTSHGSELAEMVERIKREHPVTVTLVQCGPQKIRVIKAVRELTGLGLSEAKDLVERTPSLLAVGVSNDEGLALRAQFDRLGAVVTVV